MKYGDMLYMTYPFQTDRPRMNRADRAAQFSPFAALTGFDGVVAETARLTEERPEMSEEQKAAINDALMELLSRIRERPEAEIVYFRPDARKAGGECVTKRETCGESTRQTGKCSLPTVKRCSLNRL
ncbi:MAG: hypothetical protein ACLR07_04555 [Christensenellales bacterium]